MKKALKITLSILVVVLIGYFGYTHFKKTAVLLNVIHQDAEQVIKVGIHDITKTVVFDALTAPGYYIKNTKASNKKKKKKPKNDIGVNIRPYFAVFYTLKEIDNTLFSTFSISDNQAFETFIKDYAKKQSTAIKLHTKSYKTVTLNKGKIILAWNSKQLAVSLSSGVASEKIERVFTDVLVNNKVIKNSDHPIIKALSASNDHVVFYNKQSFATLNFLDHKAQLKGLVKTSQPNAFKTKTAVIKQLDASLQLHFDANFSNTENKKTAISYLKNTSFFSKNNLDVAELLNNTNGFLNLIGKGKTTQTDTIISYEYNDNFEKVAVKTAQQKEVPNLCFSLGQSKIKSLKSYLENQSAISNNTLTLIPYYKFYVSENKNDVLVSTAKQNVSVESWQSSNFFSLQVDFQSLQNDISIPGSGKFFSALEKLDVKAKQVKDSNKVEISGTLIGTEENINIVSQLFFRYNN